MENKETSIEWLMGQALGWVKDKNNGNDHIVFPKGAIKQAKAMHKEEIMDAYNVGVSVEYYLDMPSPREYYNETYGGNNEQEK